MVQYNNYLEQVEAFRSVLKKALFFNKENEIRDYLALEFKGEHDLFCNFIGFCSAELKDPTVKVKRHKLVIFMIALAMESLSQGRADLSPRNRREMPVKHEAMDIIKLGTVFAARKALNIHSEIIKIYTDGDGRKMVDVDQYGATLENKEYQKKVTFYEDEINYAIRRGIVDIILVRQSAAQ